MGYSSIAFGALIKREVISKCQITFKLNKIENGFYIGFANSLSSIKDYKNSPGCGDNKESTAGLSILDNYISLYDKDNWNNKDLILAVPFYDSFIFYNCLTTNICVPELDFTEPVFFEEDNDLPFDDIVSSAMKDFTKDGSKYNTLKAQSIYYKNKQDFKAYLTFRCVNNRSTLDKPQLDHMGSDGFCFESWEGKNNE